MATNKEIQRVRPNETELTEKIVGIQRVAKTKGGRTFSFSALVVVGDGQGTGTRTRKSTRSDRSNSEGY